MKNNIWSLVFFFFGRNVILNKWFFKKKFIQDGDIVKYKVRFGVRGFFQRYGEEYTEIFVSVVKFFIFCFVLVFAAAEDLDL